MHSPAMPVILVSEGYAAKRRLNASAVVHPHVDKRKRTSILVQ